MTDKPGNPSIPAGTVAHDGDLRARVAAIIDREVDGFWEPLDVADAVIAELLDKEFGCPVAGHHFCRCSHRYTTEWKSNDA
jgi:hypothetical protein